MVELREHICLLKVSSQASLVTSYIVLVAQNSIKFKESEQHGARQVSFTREQLQNNRWSFRFLKTQQERLELVASWPHHINSYKMPIKYTPEIGDREVLLRENLHAWKFSAYLFSSAIEFSLRPNVRHFSLFLEPQQDMWLRREPDVRWSLQRALQSLD